MLESSESFVRFAVYTGAFAASVTFLLVALMAVVRLSRAYEVWSSARISSRWLEILGGSKSGIQGNLQSLGRGTSYVLLRQWSVAFEEARSGSDGDESAARRHHLREAAERVGMAPFALELLEEGTREQVMAGAIALGNLELERAWIPLKRRALQPHPFISGAAMQALVRIDADRSVPLLVETLGTHAEWPDHLLGSILDGLSESRLHAVIAGVVAMDNFDAVLHLFRALERLNDPSAGVVLDWLLDHLRSKDDLMACCYAALQEERLNTVLRAHRESTGQLGHE